MVSLPVNAGVSFSNVFDGVAFQRYTTICLWVVLVSTGILLEVVLGPFIIESVSERGANILWKASQLLFALFITAGLFSLSPLGFPFAVFGLYKCGFPETVSCFREAFVAGRLSAASVGAFLDGCGTFMHHAAAAYVTVGLSWPSACRS